MYRGKKSWVDWRKKARKNGKAKAAPKKRPPFTFRCPKCNAMKYMTFTELNDAPRPHCDICGVTLIETPTSRQRRLNRMATVARTRGNTSSLEKSISATVKCRACGKKYGNANCLAIHLRKDKSCFDYYFSNYKLLRIGDVCVFPDTLYHEKDSKRYKKYLIIGLTAAGEIKVVAERSSMDECERLILKAMQGVDSKPSAC